MNMKQTMKLQRTTIDKYYTNPTTVDLCIEYIKKYIYMNDCDVIIEPNASDGAFIDGIKSLTYNQLFYDIEPSNEKIIRMNFLELDIRVSGLYGTENKIHIVGKPPFGNRASLAIRFIKKACEFANTISFILPKSFKKDSRLLKRVPFNFHCIFEIDLPDNSLHFNGIVYNVPCIFQIWVKKSYNRETMNTDTI